ncbi:type VI secretion system protein TssA [Corticibacter populi]|uniref:Type VI secretion system protein TssA n=1 Tax=Corticibacter populi TaxID=1550736 RepID=A0A3M6QNC3_9BURK|nr:type VI secretion system protein TssA [Corticibacter populi]RMX04241.1 type VI secretion system protein TssA [Corticibacter populi]RZS33279.1 type VI secretion system protein ImpA [Corticibacter populi]
MTIDVAPLLAPISEARPAGEDLRFDDLFDRIREARRADDPGLDQGDWQTELKVADWRLAAELAGQALRERSKDLQAAAWLGEAWLQRQGLAAAAPAFGLLQGLLDNFWDTLHPQPEGGDLEERASRLVWFNNYASAALSQWPLTSGASAFSLNDWQTSREVDNLARQNREAHEAALAEGKPGGETVDAALAASGGAHIRGLLAEVRQAQAAFTPLQESTERHFGREAPSLTRLGDTLKRIEQVLARTAQSLGVQAPSADTTADTTANGSANGSASTPAQASAPSSGSSAAAGPVVNLQEGNQRAKADALRALQDIAAFFRRTEPHSPVPSMLERAIAWADMPLEQWLQEVVREEGALAAIRERIGLPRQE